MALPRFVILLSCAASLAAAQAPSPLEMHLAAARDAQAHTNCHLAAQEYHAAVRLMPASGELRTNEAIALFCDGQLPAAVDALRRALELKPSLTTPHLFLGLAYYRLGELSAAKQELTAFLQHAPEDPTAHLWLGYTLVAENQLAEAETQFGLTLQQNPANVDALYARGEAALEIAHAKVVALEAQDPSGAHLLRLASARYRSAGDQARADEALRRAAQQSASATPQTPAQVQEEDALAAEEEAAQSQAQANFAAILQLAPDSYRAHEVLADALLASQQQAAAIKEYEMTIQLNPTLPGVHEMLSRCLMTTGRFGEALAALRAESALSRASSPRLLTRIGQAQLAMGDEAGAARSLREALKDPNAPPQADLLLGQVFLQEQQPGEAIPLLRRYLAVNPTASTAFYFLSRAYRALGDHAAMTEALADYKRTSEDAKARALTASMTHSAAASSYADDLPTSQAPGAAEAPAPAQNTDHS